MTSVAVAGEMRDFRPADQEAVRHLILRGLRERWGEAYEPDVNPDLDDIVVTHLGAGTEVVVLERDGEILATGMLRPEHGGRGRIVRMSVDEGHRREGLGRQVVDKLVTRAQRRDMSEVLVFTDTPWTSAVALYRACGFEAVGRDETDTYLARRL